jgi:protein SCO1/2
MLARLLPTGLLLAWCAVTMLLWFMAFYRAPEATPEWLLRAQSVCFGTGESGLPDTYGWVALILGPVSFPAALLFAFGREVRAGLSAMAAAGAGRVLLGLLATAVLLEGAWVQGRIADGLAVIDRVYAFETPRDLPDSYPRLNRPAIPFELVDQHGAKVALENFRNRVVFLTFAFAHCKTVCPAIIQSVKEAAAELPAGKVETLIVTLDPWRDTPRSLPALARHWQLGPNTRILSGSVDRITGTLDAYQVPRERDPKSGDVRHPALVYMLAPTGEIAYAFNNPYPRWLSQAAGRLLASSAG